MTTYYKCKWCDHPHKYKGTNKLRVHVKRYHPEITPAEYERYFVETRYPDLDLDALVERYKSRLETMIGLQYKGIFIKHYLKTIGVARHHNADKCLMRYLKHNPQTEEELVKLMRGALVETQLKKATPESKFLEITKRDITVLRKKGCPEELIPVVEQLKLIKFTKKRLAEAIEETNKIEEEASTDTD